jgi:hypothetical protein
VSVSALIAGYAYRGRGTSSYSGVLRKDAKSDRSWTCKHDHLTAMSARKCAEGELDRRKQAGQEVFTLLRCESCAKWHDGGDSDGRLCPDCGVPMAQVKVVVVERS